jgi:hypothetical protein
MKTKNTKTKTTAAVEVEEEEEEEEEEEFGGGNRRSKFLHCPSGRRELDYIRVLKQVIELSYIIGASESCNKRL